MQINISSDSVTLDINYLNTFYPLRVHQFHVSILPNFQ